MTVMKPRLSPLPVLLSVTLLFSAVEFSDALLAAISIDLGSEYLKIALVKPGVPMEIIVNEEARRKTPNLITIKDGERLFSDAALSFSVKQPQHAFMHLVDLLGKDIDNPIVHLYRKRFPFMQIVPDEKRNTVQFVNQNETYSVESLVAMVLSNAQKIAESFAGQGVSGVVITVPAFFNQAERKAVRVAAQIAGLNLLQLINDHSAAALNYGIFRRNEITEQAKTLLIYDMGSSKTVASVVEYRLEKEKKSNEMNPKVTTLGVGYDRTLGGFELTLRMRDHLVEEFRKTFKTDVDVMENPRAMRKLLKEADRVKQVLSANPEHYAQLESVHEGQDFRIMVTRDQLEKLMIDMEPRMVRPIVDALKMAELSVDQVDQVVLMGAGTRVPKVQAVLQEFLKGKELGKFLNTDEAIAMGAVYQAAHLSKGFKVKKFGVEDLQIFPVQVDFQSLSDKSAPKSERTVHRPIFGYKSHYPTAKKILSFTSYKDDFSFNVTYGELKHLSDDQLKDFGSRIISEIKLTGITEIMEKELSEEGSVYKGVKAHFRIDDSGIVYVEGAEVYIEKKPKPTESAFASLAGKITGLFSSGSKGDDEKSEEQKEEDKSKSQVEQEVNEPAKDEESLKKEAKDEQKDSEKYDKKEDENIARANEHNTTTNGTQQTETQKHEPKETKPEMLKVSVKVNEFRKDVLHMEDSDIEKSQQLLKRFEDFERAKRIREQSQNELESLIYEVDDKIEQDEYKRYTKEDEMILIKAEVKRIRSWLDDDVGPETETDKFRTNRRKIDDLMKPITLRMREEKGRPKVVAELLSLFNHSELFLALSKNLTDSGIFTEVEISTLENVLNSTKDWWTEKSGEQEKLGPTDTPAFTIDSLKLKIAELDREVKYLLNKIAIARAKDAAKEAEKNKMETKNTTASTEERTNETDSSTVSNETIEESVEVSPKPVEGGDNATIEPEQDSEVKVSESAPQESDQVHDREEL